MFLKMTPFYAAPRRRNCPRHDFWYDYANMHSPNTLAIVVRFPRLSAWIFSGMFASLSLWPIQAWASATAWPRLSANSHHSSVCRQALKLARSQFQSGNFYLYWPPPVPHDFASTLVLRPKRGDIGAGYGIWSDPRFFRTTVKKTNAAPDTLYWQRSASRGRRFVALDIPFNWQGDWYALFSIPADWSLKQFWKKRPHSGSTRLPSGVMTYVNYSWRPPMVLVDNNNGRLWAVNMGPPYALFGKWRVFVLDQNGTKPRCTVRFHQVLSKPAWSLPEAVRRFARLCNRALGPDDQSGGTMHPIATLRLESQETMANLAMRPWALTLKPYNTRAEVDADLRAWAKEGPQYRQLYAQIQRQYPVAERALGRYYATRFHWRLEKANRVAARDLDIVFRSYFVFSTEQGN